MTLESIQSLLFNNLVNESPILSGNMKANIKCSVTTPMECEVVIEAPFYDIDKWEKEGIIVKTGESRGGITDYAKLVNEMGGFMTHNKSEHWVNRAIYEIMVGVASQMGATLINKLPL